MLEPGVLRLSDGLTLMRLSADKRSLLSIPLAWVSMLFVVLFFAILSSRYASAIFDTSEIFSVQGLGSEDLLYSCVFFGILGSALCTGAGIGLYFLTRAVGPFSFCLKLTTDGFTEVGLFYVRHVAWSQISSWNLISNAKSNKPQRIVCILNSGKRATINGCHYEMKSIASWFSCYCRRRV